MYTLEGFVELDRHFSLLADLATADDAASQSYLAGEHPNSADLNWEKLLQETLVVVLGEPGSGKSWEFRNCCAVLQKRSECAFFLELERLVTGRFAEALSPVDRDRFRRWQKSAKSARFFLDSVDESKVRRQSDFYRALDRVRDAIGRASLERARFLISSRISEWQPETDRTELLSRLGGGQPPRKHADGFSTAETKPAARSLLIVQIEPLDRERVRILVANRGVVDPDRFIREIDERSAWEFARRPVDVVDLMEFWQAKGRLGSLTEIIEHDITNKLRETTQRQSTFVLSETRARDGAEQLAAATVLCKQQQFKIPDDAFLAVDALDATACLPSDWLPNEVGALLSRPLFDSATYGRIRFHHRRVAEYLAARWFAKGMEKGCPTPVLLQQLFDDSGQEPAPRQSLIPVAAWLCAGDAKWTVDVRARVAEVCPEILFQYGDAAALPPAYRQSLLKAWIKLNSGRKQVWVESTDDALQRLADPALAGAISVFLADVTIASDVREHLVQIVRYGRLTACLPQLLAILANGEESEHLKIYVLVALRDMGTPESRRQAWDILRPLPALSNSICAIACEALYPSNLAAADFALLLEKTDASRHESGSLAFRIERLLDQQMQLSQGGDFVREFNRLVQTAPHIHVDTTETRISVRYEQLLDIIPTVLLQVLSAPSLTASDRDVVAEAISLLSEAHHLPFHSNDKVNALDPATQKHPSVRRAVFWRSVAQFRADHPTSILHPWRAYGAILHAAESDFLWLVEDIENCATRDDRDLALRMAIALNTGRSRHGLRLLRNAVSGDAQLAAVLRASRRELRWRWLRRFSIRWRDTVDIANREYRWLKRRHRIEQWWRFQREQSLLLRRLGTLRSGRRMDWLAHLGREAEQDGTRWAPTSWDALFAKRGALIARAARTGCKRAWRNCIPSLPHEKPEPNQTSIDVVVGLTGIQALVSDNEFPFESISDDDVVRATRYAVNEMNGFPMWLAELARARPVPVARVLQECVRGEWSYPADRSSAHDVLADLAWEGGILAHVVRPTVLEQLKKSAPAHAEILNCALSLVLKTTTSPDTELAEIAVRRCRETSIADEAFALWSAVCLQVDADRGVTIIEERLRGSKAANVVTLQICSLLSAGVGVRLAFIAHPTYLRAASLQRLIPLVYRYVRPAEDIERKHGVAYTPTTRDDACRFRDGLLSRLAQSDEPEATAVLKGLLSEPEVAFHRDWILHLLDERAAKDADLVPWQPTDIRQFVIDHETEPKSDHDLFRIITNRLIDIKHDVESSDNSLREEVEQDSKEYVLRRFLARKLSGRSRGHYTVPQEEEIDQEERPDIRAEHPKTAPVSIEVKWADKWTLKELLERLEAQLVGQYLRSHNSRYGIYVLGTQGRKHNWQADDGTMLTFQEIEGVIARRAQELVTSDPRVEQLRVISIDFRRPDER